MDAQIDKFLSAIRHTNYSLPPMVDLETTSLDRDQTTEWIQLFMAKLQLRVSRQLVIYTSPGWWNKNVRRNTWAARYKLWVAHWTSAHKPILPADWDDFWFWQWSADKNGKGREYGSVDGDFDMDLNVFAKDLATFRTLIISNASGSIMNGFVVGFNDLNIRAEPDQSSQLVGMREAGEAIDAQNAQFDYELWVRDDKGWSAVRVNGTNYMHRLGDGERK
jgi:hypothetical protein